MSETGTLLTESVARTLADGLTPERRAMADDGEWLGDLWRALGSLGVASLLVPEARGGAGAELGDSHGLLAELGRAAVPLPLGETILGAKLLSDAGLEVPEGPLVLAPAAPDRALEIEGRGDALRARGRLAAVPWARQASAILAMGRHDGGHRLCLLAPGNNRIEPGANLAREPRDLVVLDEAPLLSAAEVEDGALIWRTGAVLRAVQMAGALGRVLEITVEYARTREQFGRPIGRFQAIQQQLAVLAAETAAAAAAARAALVALDDGDAMFLAASAKVTAGEAASRGAAIAHQVHGAMGFTAEYPLHHHTRRLWSWREEFGNESWWAAQLGGHVAAAGADALWPTITRSAR